MIECGEEETDAGGGEVESRGWKVGAGPLGVFRVIERAWEGEQSHGEYW